MQKAKVSCNTVQNTKENIVFDYPTGAFNRNSIEEHLEKFRDRFILSLDVNGPFSVPERGHPTGIMDSFFIATDCFLVQQFPATILFASITVEAVLNHDHRMYDLRLKQPRQWLDLNVTNLLEAKKAGLDVSDLLEKDGEKFKSDFVVARNKMAHGDLSGYRNFLQEKIQIKDNLDEIIESITISQKQALNQITKCFNFVKKWGGSNPTIILDDNESINFG